MIKFFAIATVVCTLYSLVLSIAQPFKKMDDLFLAVISNFALVCYFATGIILHLCTEDETCEEYIGLSLNSFSASILVIFLILGMSFIALILIIVIVLNTVRAPQVKVVSVDKAPNLEIDEDCRHHLFMSFLRHSLDKAEAISLKLQQYMPDLIVSLETNDNMDIQSVSQSAVFIIIYRYVLIS